MYSILIFAGTTEGRQLIQQLKLQPIKMVVSVATEYGRQCLPFDDAITVCVNRLSEEEMVEMLQKEIFHCVIDATHPYAVEVSANIRNACQKTQISYFRLLRTTERASQCIYVNSMEQAVDYLQRQQGNILLTTGSKELHAVTKLIDFQHRVYLRILPMVESIQMCHQLGFLPKHIIAMQGPFSAKWNQALLQEIQCKFLVTKETGENGGFQEKILGAKAANAQVIVIEPPQEQGYTIEEIVEKIEIMIRG